MQQVSPGDMAACLMICDKNPTFLFAMVSKRNGIIWVNR